MVWLTEALQGDDFESVLIAGTVPAGEEDMGYFAAEHGVEPVFIEDMSRELSIRDIKALFKIWRLIVAEKPDIVHTHTAKAGTLGRIAAFLYKWLTPGALLGRPRAVRVFHTFHGHIFHNYYGRVKTGIFIAIEKILARVATGKIVVISARQLKEVFEDFGVGSPGQFEVIPLGLDLKGFLPDEAAASGFRENIGVAGDDILVGIVGRLTEIKNHRLFIEAVRACAAEPEFSRVRYVIIGDGHLRNELEQLANGLGIIFAGNLSDANAFYSALDVVALTSLNEGTPLTLIEAMAFGKPWLASDVGGVADLAGAGSEYGVPGSEDEIYGSGEANTELLTLNSKPSGAEPDTLYRSIRLHERGVLFDPGDAAGLIEGLRILLSDKSLRDKIGRKGKEFVNDKYSKDRLVEDIKRLYLKDSSF